MNVELAQKVLDRVRAYPERHNQELFVEEHNDGDIIPAATIRRESCGTAACLAGWAAVLAAPRGARIDAHQTRILFMDGSVEDIELYAQDLLGLTDEQVDAIFYCMDNEVAIKRLEYLTEDPDASPYDLYGIE